MPINRQISFTLLASAAAIVAAQLALPGAPIALSMCGIFAIIGVQQWGYAHCRYATRSGQTALIVLTTLVAVGAIANVHFFTWQSGGTDGAPVLFNDDAVRYWNDALYYSGLGGEQWSPLGSLLGWVYGMIFSITGPSITLLTLINTAMMAATLPLIASITYCLTGNKSTSTVSMIAAGAVCYFLVSGCIIIKDMSIIFGTALCARGLAAGKDLNLKWLCAGLVPLALVRPNYIIFIILGIIVVSATGTRNKKIYIKAAVACLLCAAVLIGMTLFEATLPASNMVGEETINHFTYDRPNQVAYQNIIGETGSNSVLHRLLLMPIAAVVQFLIPFPWNWTLHADFGYTYIYAHCAYPWYVFGALLIYYLFTFRRYRNKRLLWFTLWGLICWWAPCYFTTGTVSRYGLPMVCVLAPAIAEVITTRPYRKSLGVWLCVFAVGMTAVLLICHHLQASSMQ